MKATHDKPLAAQGLKSYRYRGRFGWVMIGAKDDADALRSAARSVEGPVYLSKLQAWDGAQYRDVMVPQ